MGRTSTPPVEFEPAIPQSGRTQVHALVREATGIGLFHFLSTKSQEISNLTAQGHFTKAFKAGGINLQYTG